MNFLSYSISCMIFFAPTNTFQDFFFGVDGAEKVGFPLRITLYTKGSVQHSLNKHINPRTYKRIHKRTVVQGGGGGVDGTPQR